MRRNGLSNCIKKHWSLYIMMIPGFLTLFVFSYVPMYGILMAFQDYSFMKGVFGSKFIGFSNFAYSFSSPGFWRLCRNTVMLGIMKIIFVFPVSIILALLFNELRNKAFKKAVQTISYLPYFISWIIVNSIVYMFLSTDYGIINKVLVSMGLSPVGWYFEPKYWRWILTFMNLWKNTGWGTIVFLAGLTSISPELYEAAEIDGAGRWKQTLHISIPGIMPVIGITFIINVANIVKDDFEMIYALVGDNANLNETVEVLGTWIYKMLKGNARNWGQASAVSLCQSVLATILMVTANWIVKKTDNVGMW